MRLSEKKMLIAVPVLTFLVGFVSFASLSLYYQVFWFDSKVDIPLLYNVSVMVGDSILLPLINYMVLNLYFQLRMLINIKKLVVWIFLGLGLSIVINIITHNFWVHDNLTDFIAFSKGKYSLIGYIHLIFSIFQMSVLIVFPFLWFYSIKNKSDLEITYSFKIWKVIFLFSFLSTFDMLNKYLFVYEQEILETVKNEGFPFVSPVFALVIMGVMNLIKKRI